MVPILAKQAVIIKCLAHSGIIVSNYECAYGMGMLANIAGITLPAQDTDIQVEKVLNDILTATQGYQAANKEEQQLMTMLQNYKPDETMDEQILLLLKMGYEETNLWER